MEDAQVEMRCPRGVGGRAVFPVYTTSSLDCKHGKAFMGNLEAYQPQEVGLDEKRRAHVMCTCNTTLYHL